MSDRVIAVRYAQALIEIAAERQAEAAVRSDLAGLADLLRASPDLDAFLLRLPLATERKAAPLQALFSGRVHALTLTFLLFLNARRRLGLLPAILAAYDELHRQREGAVDVGIVSAQPLDTRQREALTTRLAARLRKPMRISFEVSPDLIGGLRVRLGDHVEDYSLAAQLEVAKRRLLAA